MLWPINSVTNFYAMAPGGLLRGFGVDDYVKIPN